jgi:hypothetical protein
MSEDKGWVIRVAVSQVPSQLFELATHLCFGLAQIPR